MRFDLLENGIDSLKVTADILLEFYTDFEYESYQMKDAVFSFMHSVEVLGKYIIKNKNEEQIFSDKKRYRESVSKAIRLGKENVFEVDPDIQTITLEKTINILHGNFGLDTEVFDQLIEIKNFRNKLMHYTLNLDNGDFFTFVNQLRETFAATNDYLENKIPDFKNVFAQVLRKEGLREYEQYLDELENQAMMAMEAAAEEAYYEHLEALEEYHKH